MKLIERKYYLDKLIRVIDTPDIKVYPRTYGSCEY